MKTLISSLCLLYGVFANAQSTEFAIQGNGLIYTDAAVSKLKHIVDSLNLKFKVCEANKTLFGLKQARGHYITLNGKRATEMKKDLDANLSYEKIKAKYPRIRSEENLLLLKQKSKSYKDEMEIGISAVSIGKSGGNELVFSEFEGEKILSRPLKGKWIYQYNKKDRYSDENIEAFYIVDDFTSKKFPEKYARMVLYSDCLIDTTSQVFYDGAKEAGALLDDSIPSKADDLIQYVFDVTKRPTFDYAAYYDTTDEKKKAKLDKQLEAIYARDSIWAIGLQAKVDSLKANDAKFNNLFNLALEDAKVTYRSNEAFEEYLERYGYKAEALELKRRRRVIGGCSMDQGPRIHAQQIALLAAETTKWEIFLRAHLNIMNDRMDRVSDASWAWKDRQTYIKELEVLDINLLDMIIGISLRMENPSDNHYFSSIGRTGRALSESQNCDLVESNLLAMISDNELDDFNRLLMYFMFDNYNYNLVDKQRKRQNATKLRTAVSTLPNHVANHIVVSDYNQK